jgi:predicted MFS family arabinose efflux permease
MRWGMLALLFFARTMMGVQFQSVASVTHLLLEDLHVNYSEVGGLIGLYLLPGILIAIPGALLQNRFGDRTICVLGLLLMAGGGFVVGIGGSYLLVALGRITSGAGAVLLNLMVAKMVTDWFAGREIVFAMGAIGASWGLGIAVGLLVQAPLAASLGWGPMMDLVAAFCILAAALVAVLYRAPHQEKLPPVALQRSAFPPRQAIEACVIAGLVWGLFNAGLINFFSFTPAFLATTGHTLSEGAWFTSTTLWLSIVSVPLGGYLVQRAARPDAAIVIFTVLTGFVLAYMTFNSSMALFLCLLVGVVVAPPVGPILSLPARVVAVEHRAMGLAIFYTCYYLLTTIGPKLAGILRDATSFAGSPVLLAALLFMVIPAAMIPFWLIAKRLAR